MCQFLLVVIVIVAVIAFLSVAWPFILGAAVIYFVIVLLLKWLSSDTSGPPRQRVGAAPNTPPGQERRMPPFSEPTEPDCYQILGVTAGSSQDEVKQAYHLAAKQNHPDSVSHLAPEFRSLAERRMKAINEAYSRIKDLNGW